jgi:PAS domain S-box-containing protein
MRDDKFSKDHISQSHGNLKSGSDQDYYTQGCAVEQAPAGSLHTIVSSGENLRGFWNVLETAGDAFFLLEAAENPGKIVAANREASRLHGRAVPELLQLHMTDITLLHSNPDNPYIFQRIMEGEDMKQKCCVRRKDGIDFQVDWHASLVEFDKKKFILVNEKKIDANQQVERVLRESQLMLQCIFDGINEPLIMLDKNLCVKIYNKAAQEYYQVSDYCSVLGKTCHDVLSSSEFNCEYCLIPSAIREGKTLCFERPGMFDPNRVEQITFYAVNNIEGDRCGILHITDVTEKREVEKMLTRADRLASLGQLSGGIAHEIRNPLSGISIFVDILADENKFTRSETELMILREIKNDVKKIDGIIKNVLGFARATTAAFKPLNINTITSNVLRIWKSQISDSNILVKECFEEDLADIQGDDIGIQQVIHNLVRNSIEAMGSTGVLTISTEIGQSFVRKDMKMAVLRIQDTGPGILPEDVERIFNPFFTTKPEGTGLGLSISHQIIRQHRGVITCKSELGKGTQFVIEFPFSPKETV